MKYFPFLFLSIILSLGFGQSLRAQTKDSIISNTNAIPFLKAYGSKNKENIVEIQTKFGNFKIKLYADLPLYRANFIYLAKTGYFDTTEFDRIVPDFIIQAGDSDNQETINLRYKYKNYLLPARFKHKHKQYSVAAARSWDNNLEKKSSPFEFYIIMSKTGSHHLDKEHTVFAEVVSGFDILKKIEAVKTGRDEWPIQDITIKVKVIK